jgi:hypothetical protein
MYAAVAFPASPSSASAAISSPSRRTSAADSHRSLRPGCTSTIP